MSCNYPARGKKKVAALIGKERIYGLREVRGKVLRNKKIKQVENYSLLSGSVWFVQGNCELSAYSANV